MGKSHMRRSHADIGQKLAYIWKKTKIYQTIKGLIILFIKLQFSIRCNQAFRPLRTSASKHLSQPQIIYLNLSLNLQWPTGLVTCIILMHSYHPDTPYNSRRTLAKVSASDQVRSRPTYSSGLGATGLLPKRSSSFSSATLTFLKTKLTFEQGRSPSCVQQGFHPHHHQGVLKDDTLHVSTNGWSARRSTTWIICTFVGRSTILRTYVWRKRYTTSLVAPLI